MVLLLRIYIFQCFPSWYLFLKGFYSFYGIPSNAWQIVFDGKRQKTSIGTELHKLRAKVYSAVSDANRYKRLEGIFPPSCSGLLDGLKNDLYHTGNKSYKKPIILWRWNILWPLADTYLVMPSSSSIFNLSGTNDKHWLKLELEGEWILLLFRST